MRIHVIAVGRKMPQWISEGYHEYTKRMPSNLRVVLHEVAPHAQLHREGEAMLRVIPKNSEIIRLEVTGEAWTTEHLANGLQQWQMQGQDVSLLIGGANGLAPQCQAQTARCWSLSRLTFPHMMVRVLVAEQFYRAWTILQGHPYHRGDES